MIGFAELHDAIKRSGLELAVCDSCGRLCLALRWSLCCGDSVHYDKDTGSISNEPHLP